MRSRLPSGAPFAALLAALLVAGLFSLRLIPVYAPLWGLDFQNMYAFQTCEEAQGANLYSVSGEVCGDETGRAFRYPPALFQSFSWVEWFTFAQALAIWNAVMVILMIGIGMMWLWLDRRSHSGWRRLTLVVFWLALMAQFPFVFAMERSNNDIIPVALWTGAVGLFLWRRYVFSGGLAGLAIALKVYPVVAAAIVVVGMVRPRWTMFGRFVLGGVAGGLLASVFWWDDTVRYVTEILPAFANRTPSPSVISHPLQALGLPAPVAAGIVLTFFGSWVVASWRRLHHDPLLVFAGVLAISTYYSTVSWDYNLITAYPLLLVVTARALNPERSNAWKVASFASVLVIASGRGLFTPLGQLLFQAAVLTGIAWLVIFDGESPRTSNSVIHAEPVGDESSIA